MGATILRRRGGRVGGGLGIPVAVTAVLVAIVGSVFTYHAYRRWQGERSVRQAILFLRENNVRESILSLKTALRYCPKHLGARQAIATLLESSGSPEALMHRRTLMDAQPQLLEPKLAYARSALLFGKPEEAAKILDKIKRANRKSVQFLELRAELFLARGRQDLALEVYRELVDLHPKDRGAQIKLAALELQAGIEQLRDSARAALEAVASDEKFGLIALRALTRDALRRRDYAAALSWSKRACEVSSAEFSDRMQRLQALFASNSPLCQSWLSDLEKSALENSRSALELGKWKAREMGPEIAAAWFENAPEALRSEPSISLLLAECYSELGFWGKLESLTSSRQWQELDPLRLAFLARAQARQGNLSKSGQTWNLAVVAAESQPDQLERFLAMARADKRDIRQVLWIIAERDPRQVSARRELYQAYWQERNAEGMLRMMELILKENPNDRAARYNVANLLMAIGRQSERAARLARDLYEDDPQALANAVLYAFALHVLGDSKKGVDILDSRKDLKHLSSEGAAYYALVLSSCGRADEARKMLRAVDRELLLPELQATLNRVFGTVSTNTAKHIIKQ
jgi:tetratricopeptide (TPR) repeat protein